MRQTFLISVSMYVLFLCNKDIIYAIINETIIANKQCSGPNNNAKDTLYKDELYLKKLRSQNYKHMSNNVNLIKRRCGKLCETDLLPEKSVQNGVLHEQMETTPNCQALWNNSIFDEPSRFNEPVQKLPKYLIDHFSRNGHVKVTSHYYDDQETENHTSNAWGV